MNYTREDMKMAYEEGQARILWEQGIGGSEPLKFLDFMFKHYPNDHTNLYSLSYLEDGDKIEEMKWQNILAESLAEAAKEGLRLLSKAGVVPVYFHVDKNPPGVGGIPDNG